MHRTKDEQLTKRVEFVGKDADQQIATGIVMVPNAVDLQGDWERPETIQAFAEQFGNLEDVGEADGGVMHAVWPSEHISLERNEVVDEATTINGADVPAGAWVQDWQFDDDELWQLVDDGILSGYSIGAVNVSWDGPMEQSELPEEVRVPDEIPDDEPVWELVDGIVREVSAVDIPAVPDAQILETKSAYEKRLADHLGNRDGFIEEALERGHSESEAERLWEYLNRAVDVEGAGEPGSKSRLTTAAKAFLNALTGSDDGHTAAVPEVSAGDADEQADKNAPDGETSDSTDNMSDDDTNDEPPEWAQELKEQIDEQSKRIDEALEDEEKSDDPFEDAPEWAKSLKEDVDKQGERIDTISKQTGATESQQLGGAEKNGDEEGLSERQKFFIPESKRRA